MPSQRREPRKWAERYWGPQSWRQSPTDVGRQFAPTVDHRAVHRLQGGVAVTRGTDLGPGKLHADLTQDGPRALKNNVSGGALS